MKKILHIDTDLQTPNRIHKSDINEVSQITDKAQNIAFTQSNLTKQPTYNYDGYFNFDGIDDFLQAPNPDVFSGYQWRMVIKLRMDSNDTSVIFTTRTTPFGVGSVGIVCYNNHLIVQISINGSQYSIPIKLRVDLFVGEDIFCILEKKGNVIKAYFPEIKDYMYTGENVYVESYTLVSDIIEYDPTAKMGIFGGDVYLPDYTLQGRLYFMYVTDTPILFDLPYSIGDTVPNKLSDKPFNYYRRYKDGESYISHIFLKDAAIDVNNRIERIYNSIKDTYFEQTILANRPRRTNGGIEYLNGESLTQSISDEYAYGTGDFFIGRWVDFKNESVVFSIGGIIKIGIDSTNIYAETSGGKLYATRQNAINEGFKYIGFHRENGNVYLSVKGYFENSRVENINYSASQSATIGGAFVGTDTDMYNIKESVVSFVGEVLGNKVFEPPKRGGFNSDIKQYPKTLPL